MGMCFISGFARNETPLLFFREQSERKKGLLPSNNNIFNNETTLKYEN
jgi:hypothetical protein